MDQVSSDEAGTRQRVLDAAAEVFAERGYEKATVREIVERAGANVNAVNYYFQGKRGLYQTLFEQAHQHVIESDSEEFAKQREYPPEQRLRAYVAHVLRGFVKKKHTPWHDRLMYRELTEPTWVLGVLLDSVIKPRFNELTDILRKLAYPGTPELCVRLCAESVIAQCVHVIHGRNIVGRLLPEIEYTPEGIEKIADHITEFSLAAVRCMPREEKSA